MNRRNFLSSTALAAGILPLQGIFGMNETEYRQFVKTSGLLRDVLQQNETEFLKLTVYTDGSMEVLDKQRNQQWITGPVAMQEEGAIDKGYVFNRTDRSICEQYPGRFTGTKEGENIRYKLMGRQKELIGEFVCSYLLEKDELVVKLIQIDEKIPSLFFPPPFFSDALVLPERTGRIFRNKESYWTRKIYKLHQHISMRWFGGLKGENGWMCIMEKGWADSVVMKISLTLTMGYLKSLEKWTPRSIRFCFTSKGYVGQAKRFRKWAMEHDLFHSLKDKINTLPHLSSIIGGRIVGMFMAFAKSQHYDHENNITEVTGTVQENLNKVIIHNSFQEAIKIQKRYLDSGMKKGVFNYQGWMNGGYDHSHPDVWPPEKELGTIDEFLKLLHINKPGIESSIHDNYLDIYEDVPSFPKGTIVRSNGQYMTGGIWSARQCYILNSRNSLEYLKRNWEHLKNLGIKFIYIDTLTTMELYESYEKGNTQTREQDFTQRQEVVKFLYEKGIAMGSENISEITVKYGAYGNVHSDSRVQGENIPLFQLVFGDSCLLNVDIKLTPDNKAAYHRQLNRIANGSFVTHGTWERKWSEDDLDAFKSTFHVDEWHEQIATSELMNHQFLTDDFCVEKLEYANGKTVVINFGPTPYSFNGKTVAAFDYLNCSKG